MAQEIHGSHVVPYHPTDGEDKVYEVNWAPPFHRVSMIKELEKQLNVTFPPATEFCKPGEWGSHGNQTACPVQVGNMMDTYSCILGWPLNVGVASIRSNVDVVGAEIGFVCDTLPIPASCTAGPVLVLLSFSRHH